MAAPDARLARRLAAARGALLWERLWPRLWPPLGVAMAFLGIAFTDLLPTLPADLHAALLGLCGVLLLGGVWRALWRWPRVDRAAAGRRLEADGGVAHRPLSALDDRPATSLDDPRSAALWAAHQARARRAAADLRPGWPRPDMARRDRHALRAIPLLVLFVGLLAGWGDHGPRLGRALVPVWPTETVAPPDLDLWVRPPAYSGQPEWHLAAPPTDPMTVLAGSDLGLRIGGAAARPTLALPGAQRPFDGLGGGAWRLETPLAESGILSLFLGGEVWASWPLTVIPDRPPEVAIAGPPPDDRRGLLRIPYDAWDDYGVVGLTLILRAVSDPSERHAVAVTPPPDDRASGVAVVEVAGGPWAGRRAEITLAAVDAAGNETRSAPLIAVPPRRRFAHPVAAALADLRCDLLGGAVNGDIAALTLRALLEDPAAFGGDITTALGMAVARARLAHARHSPDAADVPDLLWTLALRIEDGDLGLARRAAERARARLDAALRNDADPESVARLIDQLTLAVDRLLRALERHLADMPSDPRSPFGISGMVDGGALKRLLERMDAATGRGDRALARDLLARLGGALDILRDAVLAPFDAAALRHGRTLLDRIDALDTAQQDLMDDTFGRARAADDGDSAAFGRLSDLSGRQRDLGDRARAMRPDLGRVAGAPPDALEVAAARMDAAARALARGDANDALAAQGQAIDGLRTARRAALDALRRQLGQGHAPTLRGPGAMPDPFGRPGATPGGVLTGPLDLPAEGAATRARELRDEIRRRANDPARSDAERDYLRRLLERF